MITRIAHSTKAASGRYLSRRLPLGEPADRFPPDGDDLQNLPGRSLAGGGGCRCFRRFARRSRRRIHPFFHGGSGQGDRGEILRLRAGPVARCIQRRRSWRGRSLRAIAWRRSFPAPLRAARSQGRALGETSSGRCGWRTRLPRSAAMIYPLVRPVLFALDPEVAHRVAIAALKAYPAPRPRPADPELRRRVLGLDFPNPIGLAAGFDKNAEVPDAAMALGFGFVEVGTVTPRRQAGNPRPRMFRLIDDHALINRLGFNSEGHEAVYARLANRKRRGIVGVNLGANRDSADRIADYVAGVRRFTPVADYLTIN